MTEEYYMSAYGTEFRKGEELNIPTEVFVFVHQESYELENNQSWARIYFAKSAVVDPCKSSTIVADVIAEGVFSYKVATSVATRLQHIYNDMLATEIIKEDATDIEVAEFLSARAQEIIDDWNIYTIH